MFTQKTPLILSCIVLIGLLLLLLWKPIFTSESLTSLDQSPYYKKGHAEKVWQLASNAWITHEFGEAKTDRYHPTMLLMAFMPPIVYHNALYAFGALMNFLAMLYFLRGRGFSGWAICIPAISFSFSGYTFTLISAGHNFTFNSIPYIVFCFALLDRAIPKRSLFHYAMAGGCLGIAALSGSPDKVQMFFWLLLPFGLYRFFQCLPNGSARKKMIIHTLLGTGLAGLFAVLVTLGTAQKFFQQIMPDRQKIAQGSNPTDSKVVQKQKQWEFCTNWSLPPEDMLEFIAPCVRGIETTDAKGPYWGRLGMPMHWEQNLSRFRQALQNEGNPKRRNQIIAQFQRFLGSMNYRQHTVYLGVFPIAFAFLGLFFMFNAKGVSTKSRKDLWFWTLCLLAFLLFSFGRYAPFYKIFYAFPFSDKIRCPVKLLHLVEFCLAVLFAYGLSFFFNSLHNESKQPSLKNAKPKKKKRSSASPETASRLPFAIRYAFPFGCFLTGSLLLLGALNVSGIPPKLVDYWTSVGRQAYQDIFISNMIAGLLHGAFFFFGAGFITLTPSIFKNSTTLKKYIPPAIAIIIALDVSLVCKKFIRTDDLSSIYGENPVAEKILTASKTHKGRTEFLIEDFKRPPNYYARNWKYGTFWHQGIELLRQILPMHRSPTVKKFFEKLESNPKRLWQLTSTRFILLRRDQLPSIPIVKYRKMLSFDIKNKRYEVAQNDTGTMLLIENQEALPRAVLYHQWEKIPIDMHLERLKDTNWNPQATVLTDADFTPGATTSITPVEIKEYSPHRIVINTDAQHAGILLLNDAFHPQWSVNIDGTPANMLQCNYIMRGVYLPYGKHQIIFGFHKDPSSLLYFTLSILALCILLLWAIMRNMRRFSGS